MKNKKILILLIVILSILTLSLTIFTTYLLINTPKFTINLNNKNNTKLIYEETHDIENINTININTISGDIRFKTNTENNIKIEVYGDEKNIIEVENNNNILDIEYDIETNICIGICYQEEYIIVYIPDTYNNKININTTSGDIKGINLKEASIDLKTKSGDVQINNIDKLNINSTSGDINIKNINNLDLKTNSGDVNINTINNKVNIQSTSGDIEINNLLLTESSNIKANSGDIEIDKTNDIYIDAFTTSGEIKIKNNNRKAECEIKIETTSGDIDVNDY